MTELEASKLLKNLIAKIRKEEELLENSSEYIEIQKRVEELEELTEEEQTEEIKEEYKTLEERIENMFYTLLEDNLISIKQEDILELFSYLNPDFLNDNKIQKETWFLQGYYEKIMYYFMKNLKDDDMSICNALIANKDFFDSISHNEVLVDLLVSRTNDEEKIMECIISYTNDITKVDEGKDKYLYFLNSRFSNMIKSIVKSPNYSSEFKKNLILNDDIYPYINKSNIADIITILEISKEEKKELVYNPKIYDILESYSFSDVMASICDTYDDFKMLFENESNLSKIQLNALFRNPKISIEDFKKLLFEDKIYEKVEPFSLAVTLQTFPMDFETRKMIVLDDRILSKFSEFEISFIICSKHLSLEERYELLNDSKINEKFFDRENTIKNLISNILESNDIPLIEKIILAKDKRFIDYVDNMYFEKVLNDKNLPIEVATEALFDKNLFYRLIGEYHEEYNPKERYNKGPFKYDKYEIIKRLYEKNPNIARTLPYDLLKDRVLDLGFDFIEKISRYRFLALNLSQAYHFWSNPDYLENMIKVIEGSKYAKQIDTTQFITKLIEINNDNSFYSINPKQQRKLSTIRHKYGLDLRKMTEERWKVVTEIGLRDMGVYYNGISGHSRDEIDIKLNIIPDVEKIEDLDDYTERRYQLCDKIFLESANNNNLENAKNALLNKYFSINIQEATEIVRLYATSLDEMKQNPAYDMQTKYIEQIMKIVGIEKIETLKDIYSSPKIQPLTFDETIYLDQSIRQMFSEQMSNSMFKISNRIVDADGNLVENKPIVMDFIIEVNGEKVIKKVPVYEPGFDFKMMINSTAAYGKMTLLNDNYFDSWNKSDRVKNHGICCSLIANDNMGMAAVNDVLFGFDSWDPKAVIKSAPYDIYSSNDDYDIVEHRPIKFMSAQDIINHTRHTHNEHVIERFELRNERRTKSCQNIQPSYVIVYSDMPEEIKAKAVKCSEEMNIPIVYLDKEKIVRHEVSKIDNKINEFYETEDISRKLELLEQILVSHENNRSGLKATNPTWMNEYFPSEKIKKLFEGFIVELQNTYQQTGNIDDFFQYSTRLIEILDKENSKFELTMESVERSNFIDIPIKEYEERLMSTIIENINVSTPRLIQIKEDLLMEKPNLDITQELKKVDSAFLESQLESISRESLCSVNGEVYNINTLERVILFTNIIGKNELENEHLMDLLTVAARYVYSERDSDKTLKKYGKISAQKFDDIFNDERYTEEDRKIIRLAIEYTDEKEIDEARFNKLFSKYKLPEDKKDGIKKMVYCLKDAEVLSRAKGSSKYSKVDIEDLSLTTSQKLVPIAKELNNFYDNFIKQQYARICQKMISEKKQTENESIEERRTK